MKSKQRIILITYCYRKVLSHLSLLIIVLGAICFFVANIVLKEKLDAKSYGEYSIIISYYSLVYVFGILGLEQNFIRFSNFTSKGKLQTQKFLLKLTRMVIIVTTIICSALFYFFYNTIPYSAILLVVTTYCMISLMYYFTIFRLNSQFVFAQFISALWRFILLFLVGSLFFYNSVNLDVILTGVSLGIILTYVLAVVVYKNKIIVEYNNTVDRKVLLSTGFQFFIAIVLFSMINFGDRFLIEDKVGLEEFGKYFYLTNFFLAPFTILQNYVGFKQIIHYKNNFTKEYFTNFNTKILLLGLVLGFVLFFGALISSYLDFIVFDFEKYTTTIILLLLIGVVRLYSASINSAFEVKINIKTLGNSNFYILVLTILLFLLCMFVSDSVNIILVFIISIWMIRSLIQRYLLLNQKD